MKIDGKANKKLFKLVSVLENSQSHVKMFSSKCEKCKWKTRARIGSVHIVKRRESMALYNTSRLIIQKEKSVNFLKRDNAILRLEKGEYMRLD